MRDLSRTMGSEMFGVDFRMADQQTRAVMAVVGAALTVVIKALVDKGVLTDEDLAAGWLAAGQEAWEPEPPVQPREEEGEG